MDLLKVSEVAELKGCTERNVVWLINNSKLPATELPCIHNGHKEYGISLSDLPEQLQRKYYARKRSELGLPPEPKQTIKTVVKKPFDQYTADEREQIMRWTKIVREWVECRDSGIYNKKDVDVMYIGKCQLDNPDLVISEDVLYRKYAAFKADDLDGLIDKRGGWNRGQTKIPEPVLKQFFTYYLTKNGLTVSECYRSTISWTKRFYPEFVANMPSEVSFRRQIKKLPKATIEYMCKGKKAVYDKILPYANRLYEDLNANDVWVADNHTFDFFAAGADGKPHRLYLTAFMDAKSRMMVGWCVTLAPSADSTILALRHAMLRCGTPKEIYVDNGSEFLVHDLGGRGHREKARWNKDEQPPTILDQLGIKMVNANVKNARAKHIERAFCTLKNVISKKFPTYCGGTILERPESLAWLLKHEVVPPDDEVRKIIETLIDYDYNMALYGGKENCYKGMSRLEVFNASIGNVGEVRKSDPDDIALLLARTTRYQKIKRNGVCIKIRNSDLWYSGEDTWKYIGEEVYVRYDPADINTVRIYDRKTDQYRFTWVWDRVGTLDYREDGTDGIAALERRIAHTKRDVSDYSKGLVQNDPDKNIDILKLAIEDGKMRGDKFEIKLPPTVIPLLSDKFKRENPDAAAVDKIEFDAEFLRKLNENADRRKEINNKGRF